MHGHGKTLGVGFLRHSAEDVYVHSIKWITGGAGFEDALDRVDLLNSERVHLLPRFLRRCRSADELRDETGAHWFRQKLSVFGPVTALGGKERPAHEQFRSE